MTELELRQRTERVNWCLRGHSTLLTSFGPDHLRNPDYISWLHDHDVVETLYLRDYLAKPVSFEEVASYIARMNTSGNNIMLALHDQDDEKFIGTLKVGHIDWDASIADIGIMIGDRTRWG